MNTLRALLLSLSATVVVVSTTACPREVIQSGCQSDIDCGVSQRCDASRGLCLCLDNNACDPTEFCNVAGFCQPQLECLNNEDCADGQLCNTNDGTCVTLANGTCLLDSHCPYGAFCAQNRACTPGCKDAGDCPIGTPCINGQCDETPGACDSNQFCDFGQFCNASTNRCQDHARRAQLCTTCDPTSATACGGQSCLIDSSIAPTSCTNDAQCARGECRGAPCLSSADCGGGQCQGAGLFTPGECAAKTCEGNFCGADDCSDTNPCPRGYTCNRLQIVSNTRCTIGSGSAECGAGRTCQGGGENGAVGFCSCASNNDCPVSFEFPDIRCENPGPNGACIVGTTCGPSDGLLCEDLR